MKKSKTKAINNNNKNEIDFSDNDSFNDELCDHDETTLSSENHDRGVIEGSNTTTTTRSSSSRSSIRTTTTMKNKNKKAKGCGTCSKKSDFEKERRGGGVVDIESLKEEEDCIVDTTESNTESNIDVDVDVDADGDDGESSSNNDTNHQKEEEGRRDCYMFSCLVLIVIVAILCAAYIPKIINNNRNLTLIERISNDLSSKGISTIEDLTTPGTPQYKAVEFISKSSSNGLQYFSINNNKNIQQRIIERYVLTVLYYHFNGPKWNYDYFGFVSYKSNNPQNNNVNIDHCYWFDEFESSQGSGGGQQKTTTTKMEGVICGPDGYVAELNLSWNNLYGHNIPSEIRYLDKLNKLHLYFNTGITGTLPESMKDMSNLQNLVVMNCNFDGTIPEWLGTSKTTQQLSVLVLSLNQFHGSISTNFAKLTNLQLLGLDTQQGNSDSGLSGDISIFKNMNLMERLYLENNQFTGSIDFDNDNDISWWPNLKELDISNNMISGSIPSSFLSNSQSLRVLDIHNNVITGNLDFIKSTTTVTTTNNNNNNNVFDKSDQNNNGILELLAIQYNLIEGTIPEFPINYFHNLQHLDLSYNRFTTTGTNNNILPTQLTTELTTLRYLSTSGNTFNTVQQPIPDLTRLTNLVDLSMKGNNLVGTIPDYIGSRLLHLRLLDLDNNQLSGTIPSSIQYLYNLQYLLLNRNLLTGTLPDGMSLQYLQNLDVLLLDNNSFIGNAETICNHNNNQQKLSVFISDCLPPPAGSQQQQQQQEQESEFFECRCCTKCCSKGDTQNCNDKLWTGTYDPIWFYKNVLPNYDDNNNN